MLPSVLLALLHSKGKHQQMAALLGFAFAKLMPEIAQAIAEAKEGEVIETCPTKLGYQILRIEKRFRRTE